MSMLLAKIIGLLILAAVFGAWLARWWLLRRYEDVTLPYTAWQRDWASWRNGLESRLAQPQRLDMQPLLARLDAIEQSLEHLHAAQGLPGRPLRTVTRSRLDAAAQSADIQDVHDVRVSSGGGG
jgi:hypothetical protein